MKLDTYEEYIDMDVQNEACSLDQRKHKLEIE